MSCVIESVQVRGVNTVELEGFPSALQEEKWRAFIEKHRTELGLSSAKLSEIEGVGETLRWVEEYEYGGQGPAAVVARVVDAKLDGAPNGTVSAIECDDGTYVGIQATELYPWEAAEFAGRFPGDLRERFEGALASTLRELGVSNPMYAFGEWADTITS